MATRSIRRALLLAFAVGIIFSFPNWWWYFTSPDYSVARGYILSDDDLVPYIVGINSRANAVSGIAAYFRTYETRYQVFFPVLSNWLVHGIAGRGVKFLGSFELFVPLALWLSGSLLYLTLYLLALELIRDQRLALAVALFSCVGWQFYLSWIVGFRQWLSGGVSLTTPAGLSLLFPGMVNGYQLYPFLRWPVPGLAYWYLIVVLIWLLRVVTGDSAMAAPSGRRAMYASVLGLGLVAGLSAYIFFYFWTFILGLLAVMTAGLWLFDCKSTAHRVAGALMIAVLTSLPLLVFVSQGVFRPDFLVRANDLNVLVAGAGSPAALLRSLATHGLMLGYVVVGWRGGPRPNVLVVGAIHLTVILLTGVEALGLHFQAWQWLRYIGDPLLLVSLVFAVSTWSQSQAHSLAERRQYWIPLGRPHQRLIWLLGWLIFGIVLYWTAPGMTPHLSYNLAAISGIGLLPLSAHVLRKRTQSKVASVGQTWQVVGLVVLYGGLWYLYHRFFAEVDWVAWLPLIILVSLEFPRLARFGLGLALALSLVHVLAYQIVVRPYWANDFFRLPHEYREAFAWLDRTTAPESVVMTDSWQHAYLVRAYTHNLTYTVGDPTWFTPISEAERQERFMIQSSVFGVMPETLAEMTRNSPALRSEFKQDVNVNWIGDKRLDSLYELHGVPPYDPSQYQNSFYRQPVAELLTRYRVDFIWVGPWERQVARRGFDDVLELRLAYRNSLISIYEVVR